MPIMNEDTSSKVKEALQGLEEAVHILLFTSKKNCDLCNETKAVLDEIVALSEKVSYEALDIDEAKEAVVEHRIDKVPAMVLSRGTQKEHRTVGIRFFGIPAGYEFTSLLEAILSVSKGKSGLSEEGKEYLKGLKKDIHIQVFVTPSCPYCFPAVILAHQMALESDRITADMVEAEEFPSLAIKYKVMGVPRTVVNETHHQEGAAPERMIMDLIKKAETEGARP